MLVYSAKTARQNTAFEVMSTAQKEQLVNAFKKFAVRRFKEESDLMKKMFWPPLDGHGDWATKRRALYLEYKGMKNGFYGSKEYQALAMVKSGKLGGQHFSQEDEVALLKKLKPLLTKAGYKCELLEERRQLSVWKPVAKK